MSKGAKQNWFQSPHTKNGFWFFHEQKHGDLNFYKNNCNQKTLFLTPSRYSKPIQIQKNRNTPCYNSSQHSQTDNCKFDDVHLPDMFANTKIQRHIINEKINFEDSSVIKQEQDYMTPHRQIAQSESNCIRHKNYVFETTAKKPGFCVFQEKKTRPKQKGLRMLSQKAYQIVLKMNGATYKQVANVLVDQLATEDNVQIDGKDQQNIKRRVYDALNVLIALGVLRKDGRKIHGVQKKKNRQEQMRIQKEELSYKIKQLHLRRIQKQTTYKKLISRRQMFKALIKRNREMPEYKNKIDFPLIALMIPEKDEEKIINDSYEVQIKTKYSNMQTFGDLDIIQQLRSQLKEYIQ